jgi:hypothetical protein
MWRSRADPPVIHPATDRWPWRIVGPSPGPFASSAALSGGCNFTFGVCDLTSLGRTQRQFGWHKRPGLPTDRQPIMKRVAGPMEKRL